MESIEIHDSWYGVAIPSWLRAFDCRAGDDDQSRLMGSERAEVDLGLGHGYGSNACTPLSCIPYIDARTCSKEELHRQVKGMVEAATKLYNEWKSVKDNRSGGGSVVYRPVAIAMANFGWSVIADKRTAKVQAFRAPNPQRKIC